MNAIQKISNSTVEQSTPEKYILSINLRIDGLSFLVQNKEGKNLHMEAFEWLNVSDWSKTTANLQNLLKNHELLKLKYPKVQVLITSVQSLLIPESLFIENKISIIYENYLGIKDQFLRFSKFKLNNKQSILVFGVENGLAQIINTKWNTNWDHMSKFFLLNCKSDDSQRVFLKFHISHFEVAAFDVNGLNAHNYFEYSSAEEFIFNLLSFVRQIGFDIAKLKIEVGGSITETSALYKLVEKYIPNTSFKKMEQSQNEKPFTELIEAANYANR